MLKFHTLNSYPLPGRGPAGLTWDGRFLWHSDYRESQIFRLDPQTGEVVSSLVCPGVLSGLAWDGRSLWQALLDEGWLRCINPETNDFDQTIVVPEAGWLSGVAWDGRWLWVVSQQMGQIFALDRDSSKVVRTIPCPVAGGGLTYHEGSLWLGVPETMQFDARYQEFDWVGEKEAFAFVQIEPESGREIGRFPLDFLPMGIAWVNEELWLVHSAARKLYRTQSA